MSSFGLLKPPCVNKGDDKVLSKGTESSYKNTSTQKKQIIVALDECHTVSHIYTNIAGNIEVSYVKFDIDGKFDKDYYCNDEEIKEAEEIWNEATSSSYQCID